MHYHLYSFVCIIEVFVCKIEVFECKIEVFMNKQKQVFFSNHQFCKRETINDNTFITLCIASTVNYSV